MMIVMGISGGIIYDSARKMCVNSYPYYGFGLWSLVVYSLTLSSLSLIVSSLTLVGQ